MQEIKARIPKEFNFRQKLEELGAEKQKEEEIRDTYFSGQNPGALKITETEEKSTLKKYEKKEEGFSLMKNEKLASPEEKRQELKKKHGVKADQKKHKEFYNLDEKTVIVNSIENLGDFLIVQGESIDKDFIEQKLGIEEPEYIEFPFSDL